MSDLSLKVSSRAPKTAVSGVKGVVYGKEHENKSIVADQLSLERLYHIAGYNRVFDLYIDDKTPVKVLFQEVQYHPVTNHVSHFDLNAVSLKDKISAEVPIHLTGDAPAVVTHAGILTTNADTVEVEAEPLSLPEQFEIDISNLKEVGDHITVADLKAPAGVEILTEPEILLVKIDPIVEEAEVETEDSDIEVPEEGEISGETTESEETADTEDKAGSEGA